ncbi:glycosyl transferase, group 1 [Aeropyrum pernix]|uniref:Glycosyl transferase, group 1 n=1 Tax=Aeropyrum pernix TaxID=56636 RepID=A0A401H7S7_AERPX|nr:glycosyl transferase, group 1 [Aeropyrum pernix]
MLGGLRRVEDLDSDPPPRGSRIVMVMDYHPSSVGGVQSHVRDLTRLLQDFGYDVVIVSRALGKGDVKDLEAEGHYIVKPLFPLEIIFVPPDPSDLRREIESLKPDVVHSHHIYTLTSLLALKAARDLGLPRIATNHSIFLAYDKVALWRIASIVLPTRYLLPNAQAVISVSTAADKMVEGIVGDSVDRYIIPNGVDVERFKPSTPKADYPLVLFIGRLVWRKGAHVLVRAFRHVVDEIRDAKLYIGGKGEFEPILKLMIARYNLENNVKMLGVVPESEKPSLYSSAWVTAVPSIVNESFGIVALESLSSGTPVVASRQGGLKDVVKHGKTGLLVKPGSSKELAKALITLLQDSGLRKRMSEEARKIVLERYDWKKVVPQILKVYGHYMEAMD